MRRYVIKGENPFYPVEVETWRFGEKVPSWLIEICKIESFDSNNEPILTTKNKSDKGGCEYVGSEGKVIFRTSSETDYIVKDVNSSSIYVMSDLKFKLLYK